MAHDAFDVAEPSAAAVVLALVEGDDGVAAFPHAGREGIAAVADADAKGPDADEVVEFSGGGGEPGGYAVGIVEQADGSGDVVVAQLVDEEGAHAGAFELRDIGGVFDHAVADQAGHGKTDGRDVGMAVLGADDLLADGLDEGFGVELDEGGFVGGICGVGINGALEAIVDDESGYDSL